mgnify:CR=1 FL=1
MKAKPLQPPIQRGLRTVLSASLALLAAGVWAQTPGSAPSAAAPIAQASTAELIERLGGNRPSSAPLTRSFRRTTAPDESTHLCPEVGTDAPVEKSAAGPRSRNLTVVAYAAEGAPALNLDIRFATNSDQILATSQPLLANLAQALTSSALASATLAVAGHTDASGNLHNNQVLSCARAIAVRQHLIGLGVAAERLSAYGFGPDRPLEPGAEVSAINRRVELRRAN